MSDEEFFSDSDSAPEEVSTKKTRKHAPKEASSKAPVSRIREIPGLKPKKQGTLYRDVRFDTAYGDVNYSRIRDDYKFLDEYREKEIKEMDGVLKNKKLLARMSEDEVDEMKYRNQALKSRMNHLKEEKFQEDAIKKYKEETGKKWLKRSDRKKVVRVAKFESMSGRQRSKVMERKRKKKLGKEMRSFAFSK